MEVFLNIPHFSQSLKKAGMVRVINQLIIKLLLDYYSKNKEASY